MQGREEYRTPEARPPSPRILLRHCLVLAPRYFPQSLWRHTFAPGPRGALNKQGIRALGLPTRDRWVLALIPQPTYLSRMIVNPTTSTITAKNTSLNLFGTGLLKIRDETGVKTIMANTAKRTTIMFMPPSAFQHISGGVVRFAPPPN